MVRPRASRAGGHGPAYARICGWRPGTALEGREEDEGPASPGQRGHRGTASDLEGAVVRRLGDRGEPRRGAERVDRLGPGDAGSRQEGGSGLRGPRELGCDRLRVAGRDSPGEAPRSDPASRHRCRGRVAPGGHGEHAASRVPTQPRTLAGTRVQGTDEESPGTRHETAARDEVRSPAALLGGGRKSPRGPGPPPAARDTPATA